MICLEQISENEFIPAEKVRQLVIDALSSLGVCRKVMVVPPDSTRYASGAGQITHHVWEFFREKLKTILPATGLHASMSLDEMKLMFPDVPPGIFRHHDPVRKAERFGLIPCEIMTEMTDNVWNQGCPIEINPLPFMGNYDLIVSIGQVLPHEVAGMSNYNKNIIVGIGGKKTIDITHYISALCGIENTMGKIDTPVRRIFNLATKFYLASWQILYIMTVSGMDESGNRGIKGLFIGNDDACFIKAAEFSQKINITAVDKPLDKVVVYLPADEFKSTWLGNKAIYRTRSAIRDGGELIILGPGIKKFGETGDADSIIRKYGYAGTEKIRELADEASDLSRNLSVAAHLIHGSTDGRFKVTLCPGELKEEEVKGVNFSYCSFDRIKQVYNPDELKPGYNMVDGEEIYFIRNPGQGLWKTAK